MSKEKRLKRKLRKTKARLTETATKLVEATVEIARLRCAIRDHRDQKLHDRCWLDDQELYAVLPEGLPDGTGELPPKNEFLSGCARYYELRKRLPKEDAVKIALKFNEHGVDVDKEEK